MANEYLNNKNFEKNIARFQKAKRELNIYKLITEDIQETQKRVENFQKPESWVEREKKYEVIKVNFNESQNELATAFYALAENIMRYAKFSLIDGDDGIQDCILTCFEKIDRFDHSRGSKAFNYFTTVQINSMRQLYRTTKNYSELKRKYQEFQQSKVGETSQRNKKSKNKNKN